MTLKQLKDEVNKIAPSNYLPVRAEIDHEGRFTIGAYIEKTQTWLNAKSVESLLESIEYALKPGVTTDIEITDHVTESKSPGNASKDEDEYDFATDTPFGEQLYSGNEEFQI
jgi:hypothetical protein